jgi:hypothetical protein
VNRFLPALAPLGVEHALDLGLGHGAGVRAQPPQDLGQRGRQQVAGFHRDQLPHLHRGAAQLGQLVGHAARIARREQQVAQFRAVALRQLAGALGNHAAGNARGHPAETGQAGAATAWHGEGGRG